MKNLGTLITDAIAVDPARPLLTYYHDGTGERTELSAATLANWVAKTANLLVDGLGLGAGDRALVRLPAHWQTAAVLFGCWSAGLDVDCDLGTPTVASHSDPAAGITPTSDQSPAPGVSFAAGPSPAPDASFAARPSTAPDVSFASAVTAASITVGDRYLVSLHPLGLPLPSVPPGWLDYAGDVRGYGDHFGGMAPATARQEQLRQRAIDRAAEWGLSKGDRVLIDADQFPDPVDWLLAPLSIGASVVLCVAINPALLATRIQAEKITKEIVTK